MVDVPAHATATPAAPPEPKFQLDAVELVRSLNAAARRVLVARSVVRRYPAGTVLWRAGARPGGLVMLLEGRVRVVRGANGRQHVVHVEGPGATLGEVPLFAGGRYPATAIAAEDSVCAVADVETVHAAIAEDPSLAILMLQRMACRVRDLVERLDGRSARTVRSRLAAWLLDRHQSAGSPFTLGCSQAELAEELGTVREVLVRELRRLRDEGVIGRGRPLEVHDAATLRRIASE
jgi:CRP-like cAMP-binding protein